MKQGSAGRAALEASAIFAAALLIGLVSNALRPGGIALSGKGGAPVARAFDQIVKRSDGAIREIGLGEALQAFESGVPFLDARSPEEFRQGHVFGARNLPAPVAPYAREACPDLELDREVVVYCRSSDCDEGEHVVRGLYGVGFKAIRHFRAGYSAWLEAGYPTMIGD